MQIVVNLSMFIFLSFQAESPRRRMAQSQRSVTGDQQSWRGVFRLEGLPVR